jgi:MoxR-like ATPase
MENEKPSNEKPSNEKPSNEKPSNEKPSNEKEIVINLGKIDPIAIIKDAAETYVQKATDEFIKQNADARFEGSVKRYIAEQIESLRPTVVTTPTGGKVEVKGRTHKEFKKALFLACLEKQLFIAGPSGSGKTSLAEQVSKALELPFSFISCSAGLSEAHLLGRMLFDVTYITSEFVKLYENGGVFLFDEVDAADANTMLVINSALSNGVLSLPNRKESQYAKRHENFICICAGNTWGSGSFEYHGRNQLDVAFLDRFALSKLVVDYDRGLEKEMCAAHPDFASILWLLRDSVEKNRIRRVVSTRAFISGARQLSAGMTPKLLIDALMIGWSAEENKKVSADITNEIVALEAEMKKGKVGVKPVTA